MSGRPAKPQALIAMEIETAMRGHVAGRTYRQIAEELNIAPSTVGERIKDGIDRLVTPAAEDMRRVELARLDLYLNVLEPKVATGDLKAIETALKVQDRRAKLLGLDKPILVEVTNPVGSIDAEVARLEAELGLAQPQVPTEAVRPAAGQG